MIRDAATVIASEGAQGPNLAVAVDKGSIRLKLNSARVFETLVHREVIAALILKKLNRLVEEYLERARGQEDETNKAC